MSRSEIDAAWDSAVYNQKRAEIAEAMIKRSASVLCEQMRMPNAEHIADAHNNAVLEIRKYAAALDGK